LSHRNRIAPAQPEYRLNECDWHHVILLRAHAFWASRNNCRGDCMMLTRGKKAALTAVLMAAFTLGGCVVTARPDYVGDTVMVAPPPPQTEVIGVAPAPGYIWLGGYWGWEGGRHVWVAGHWAEGRAGYRWVPHHWVRSGGGWRLAAGHWQRR
jgi:hypothetical protein